MSVSAATHGRSMPSCSSGKPELGGLRGNPRETLRPQGVHHRLAVRVATVLEHPRGRIAGVEFREIHLHHQLGGVLVGAGERARQCAVPGFEQMHRLGEVYRVVRAPQRPHRALRLCGQAAEKADCEEPVPHGSTQ